MPLTAAERQRRWRERQRRAPAELSDAELLAAGKAAFEAWIVLHREEWRRRNLDKGRWRMPSEIPDEEPAEEAALFA